MNLGRVPTYTSRGSTKHEDDNHNQNVKTQRLELHTQESNKKIKCENMNLNVQEVRDLGTNPSPITIHF